MARSASDCLVRTALELDYLTAEQLRSKPNAWWDSVLGVAGFGSGFSPPRGVPLAACMLPGLDADAGLFETWQLTQASGAWTAGESTGRRVRYRHCDGILFGCLTIDGRTVSGSVKSGGFREAVRAAYLDIFEVLGTTQHTHLVRVWNYLPDIHGDERGEERYRVFNAARQAAFRDAGRPTDQGLPAASALGSPAGSGVCIYFLAAINPPLLIENPRQTNAYRYPSQFGRHPPAFSRACLWGGAETVNLFVSGTASIVGYESMHEGDVIAQTRETMLNIAALVAEANRAVAAARFELNELKLKVYVRNSADLGKIRATLAQIVTPRAPAVYLRADVCRHELLVEIEAAL